MDWTKLRSLAERMEAATADLRRLLRDGPFWQQEEDRGRYDSKIGLADCRRLLEDAADELTTWLDRWHPTK